jgi:hypothetical protein
MEAVTTRIQTFIPVCCVCGLAREDGDPSGDNIECWSEFDEYLTRHGLHETAYRLTHAYCPICARRYVPAKKKSVSMDVSDLRPAADITTALQHIIRQQQRCDLDALVRACPQFTWNQIFLEVDRLSRTGDLQLTLSERRRYEVGAPLVETTGMAQSGQRFSS